MSPPIIDFLNNRYGLYRVTRSQDAPNIKFYSAIFVCFTNEAIHLETVFSLTEESYVNAIKRFIAHRGVSVQLNSDNATTFVAARKDILELRKEVSQLGTDWFMIPAVAPHFGGLWEAGIKSLKHHLRRTMKIHKLHIENFKTLLAQIGIILNSRPLVPSSDDPFHHHMSLSIVLPYGFLFIKGKDIRSILNVGANYILN